MATNKYRNENNNSNDDKNENLSQRQKLEGKQRVRKKEKKSVKIKRIFTAAFLTILALIIIGGIYLVSFIFSLDNNNIVEAVKPASNDTVNILLVGMDIGDVDNKSNNAIRRTDTIMVLNYNPRTDYINIVSIPRDTLIEVENAHDGKGNYIPYWKINSAYALGGEEEIIEHVEKLLDLTVNYMVEVDYEAFRSLIDAIGGIEMYIDRDMYYDDDSQDLHINFTKGETVLLDGKKAEEFFRWRQNNDGTGLADGDLGRIKNQQKLISEVIKKCTSPSIVFNISDIFNAIKSNIVTNINGQSILYYGMKMISNNGISMNTIKGYDERIYGQDFLVADPESNKELIDSLKPTAILDTSITRKGYNIQVLNGTRINGLAGNLKDELGKIGYDNLSVGNFTKTKESFILCNDKDLKKLLSNDTGIKKIEKNKQDEYKEFDAVIIIGEDYLVFE